MQLMSKSRKKEEELISQMKCKGVRHQNAFLLGAGVGVGSVYPSIQVVN